MKSFVLVVDDNLVNLNYIGGQLEETYRVVVAKSGEQALKICKREAPDLILLDVEMPGMNGFETIAEFQKNPALSGIPVIFLTANRDTETEIRGLECGAVDFVTKPFNKSILLHRIAHHLRFSQYQRSLERTVRELEDNIVNGFSEIVEYRDANTGGHIVRTARYVDLLGNELRHQHPRFADELLPAELDMMVRAASLHDIGKIAISDTILLKPAKLTDAEFEIMKTHAAIGGKLLRQMYARMPTQRYLQYGIMIAEGHHEKFDGSGYPDGVVGENIPLCARLMAIADVYDALIESRCYRPGLSHEAASEIIVKGRGSHFDPVLIDIFVKIQNQFQAVAERLK
ncbi:two-component system response regulator [Betaproteobacteria bacterium]|nr:two-component system response regulator [Betaproteobacteria bacterium]GHT92558.1 two-component system response regulator [Betaproteobacteria bacterium]GHU44327.1 two-component system response regulator [Betaproteobacteria bacterium]